MSMDKIRPFFKARLESLGYSHWVDSFSDLNTPRTQIDRSFVNPSVSFSVSGLNASDVEITTSYELSIKLEAFRDPDSKIDEALERAEAIIQLVCSEEARLATPEIKQVRAVSGAVVPLDDDDNDNVIQLNLSFDVTTSLCIN